MHYAILQGSHKKLYKIPSVKNNSTNCTLYCYVFQFLSNHHKTIRMKCLKNFTLWSVTKNTKNRLDSNILFEISDKDSSQIETCIKVVGLLLNW